MKIFFSLFIIFTIAIRPVLPLIDYAVNYDFIVAKLCENKNKPELLCNGKCYLSKELAKQSPQSNHSDSAKVVTNILDNFVNTNIFNLDCKVFIDIKTASLVGFFKHIKVTSFSKEIFHPPLS